jgi:hypothetical protein
MHTDTSLIYIRARAVTADDMVEAFMGLVDDSVLDVFTLVRSICGYEEEGLVALATGVLSHRWLSTVCSRQLLLFAESQYCGVVNRVLNRRENHKNSTGSRDESEFGRTFIRDRIAEFLMFLGAFCSC